MRITTQLLRSRARKPLHSVEYLDLSSLGIERIERLGVCAKVKTLSLSDNRIDYVSNLHVCPQLWKLDLSNNDIKNVEGISRFVALGQLVLSNNQLTWPELAKLRHIHILDLNLHGNPHLEQDPYYRIHVIDCLPNVWMLDGRVITSAERIQVQHFFQDSALTDHPVRHKSTKEHFTPTEMKNISVNGVFGEKTVHLMRRFPTNGAMNVDTDRRRLKYLAYSLQEELKLEAKYNKRDSRIITESGTFLEDVLSIRQHDREKANMLLLLLVASLEFAIPIHLMQETLDTTKLSVACNVRTMELFLLPRDNRCNIVSLLLSAVKIDKDLGEEGGLYDKLYLCLYYSVSELNKLALATEKTKLKMDKKSQAVYADSRTLIGAEVVQLMCIVPAFFDYVTKDPGVMHLVTTATCDGSIVDRVRRVITKLEKDAEPQHICEEVADLILSGIQQNALNMLNRTKGSNSSSNVDVILNMKKKALPRRPQSSPIFASEYHAKGHTTPRWKRAQNNRLKSAHLRDSPQPQLGDAVLLGPQNVARIISIPEPDIILVQMDVVPAETGAMVSNSKNPDEHYTYLDMNELYWDHLANYWRPVGTVGDRISIQVLDSGDSAGLTEAGGAPPSSTCSPPVSPSGGATTPGTTTPAPLSYPAVHPHVAMVERVPRAVSAQLKERLNLKLQLGNEQDGASSRTQQADTDLQHQQFNSTAAAHPLTPPAVPVSTPKDQVADHVSNEVEKSVDAPPISVDPHAHRPTAPAPSLESSADPTVVVTVSDLDNTGDMRVDDTVSTFDAQLSGSSAHHLDTQPPATDVTTTRTHHPEDTITIDIPQMAHESESVGDLTSTRSDFKPGDDIGVVPPENRESFQSVVARSRESGRSLHGNRQFSIPQSQTHSLVGSGSGTVGYKMIVAADKHYVSSYQAQRTEAWKNSKLSRPTSSVTVATPTMQLSGQSNRTPSPGGGGGRAQSCTSSRGEDGRGSAVRYLRGDTWLAGGRDLHWESRVNRPRTAHTPGWKEGLSPRPKSAAAMRALKRNKSPAIITPSSMAYEMAYGRGPHNQVPDLTPLDYVPSQPMQHRVRSGGHFPVHFPTQPARIRSAIDSRSLNVHHYPMYWLYRHRHLPVCNCCLTKYTAARNHQDDCDHDPEVALSTPSTCEHTPNWPNPELLLPVPPDELLDPHSRPPTPGPSCCSRSECGSEPHLSVEAFTMKPVMVTVDAI